MQVTKVLEFWGKTERNDIADWYDKLAYPGIWTQKFQEQIKGLVSASYKEAIARYWVKFVDYEPYPDANAMRDALRANRGILISTLYNNAPIMPNDINLMFRFAHDIDHCKTENCNFAFRGEVCAYSKFAARAKRLGYGVDVQQWLFTEIVGQAAYRGTFGTFGEQKFSLAPVGWVNTVAREYGY
jgi:hypothetical protein